MERLRELVESWERKVEVYREAVRVASLWVGDGTRTRTYYLDKEQLIVLKIQSHQEKLKFVPNRFTVTMNAMADSLSG